MSVSRSPENLLGAYRRILPWIRSQFLQLEQHQDGSRRTYLDNAAGTLSPATVADAMAREQLWANPQPGRGWPGSEQTDRLHARLRLRLAEFLNAGDDDSIFLSESTTSSLYKLREALAPSLSGRSVIVTDADHFANISAWEHRAEWEVRRAPMLPDGLLDRTRLRELVDSKTAVVAMTLASNGLGTILPLAELVPEIRQLAPDARIVLDAVHGAPHLGLDVSQLDVDALAFSAYKLYGPMGGVLWLRNGWLPSLDPYRVEPHLAPETRLEWGTLNNALAAGIIAAVDYLESLGERLEPHAVGLFRGTDRTRRRLQLAAAAIRAHERELSFEILESWPAEVPLLGIIDPHRVDERVPTFGFLPPPNGVIRSPEEFSEQLWRHANLQIPPGNHYSGALLRGLNIPSACRASFAHYNNLDDAHQFLAGLTRAVGADVPPTGHGVR